MLKLTCKYLNLLLLFFAAQADVFERDETDDIRYPDTRQALYNDSTMSKLRAVYKDCHLSYRLDLTSNTLPEHMQAKLPAFKDS